MKISYYSNNQINFTAKNHPTSNNGICKKPYSDIQTDGQQELMSIEAAAALSAVTTAESIIDKDYEVVESNYEYVPKFVEKINKQGQILERKVFRNDGETVYCIFENINEEAKTIDKLTYFREDGKTINNIYENIDENDGSQKYKKCTFFYTDGTISSVYEYKDGKLIHRTY